MADRHKFRERLSRIRTQKASLPGGGKIDSPFDRPITFVSHFEFMGASLWKTAAALVVVAFMAFFAQFVPPEVCSPFVAVIIGVVEMFQSFDTPT